MGEIFKGLSTPAIVILIGAGIVVLDHMGIFDSPINGIVGDKKYQKVAKPAEK